MYFTFKRSKPQKSTDVIASIFNFRYKLSKWHWRLTVVTKSEYGNQNLLSSFVLYRSSSRTVEKQVEKY